MSHNYTSLDARQTTAIITGTLDNGDFQQAGISANGHLHVDVKSPVFPFGSLHVEQATILFQGDGVYGLNSGQLGETGEIVFQFSDFVNLAPGETMTIAARASTGTPAFVSASINTREDQ